MNQHAPPPVVVDSVHKRFEIPREQVSTLKERALHPFRRSPTDTLNALRGVSFAVAPGEFFGIVGRNGSGKSTLLKCLAGIYGVDEGNIYVNGRMSAFIELGVGFNPDLPARDNALLNATMLGLSPREARRRFDSVIDFAELGEFVDLKIKNYSSGMLVRLAFSVMIHVDAEILLIDEVLAVGDAAFQQKCYDEFERIRRSGATVLFVTHDMSAVQRFCDRAMLLEHGRQVELGDPEHVGNRYLELNFSEQARQAEQAIAEQLGQPPAPAGLPEADIASESAVISESAEGKTESGPGEHAPRRDGDGRAEIMDAWVEDEHGQRSEALPTGRPCTFAARVRFLAEVEDPLFAINVQNSRRDHLLSASNVRSEPRCGVFQAEEEVVFEVRFENVLAPDRYHVTPSVARHGGAWIDRRERMLSVVVTGTRSSDALLELPYELVIERRAPHVTARELTR
ncbi:MAG TPA: ABC transporter ATP-binding protein [Solirubrobacteraceae bacterium]|jgi:ABC-type polysaccharide/polyol phosphate transport system ATPase subunit|nr:ABC transporter ATP-binding protein [Solirubrobacteraceae bacterium]